MLPIASVVNYVCETLCETTQKRSEKPGPFHRRELPQIRQEGVTGNLHSDLVPNSQEHFLEPSNVDS